jgi:hypothetical protein
MSPRSLLLRAEDRARSGVIEIGFCEVLGEGVWWIDVRLRIEALNGLVDGAVVIVGVRQLARPRVSADLAAAAAEGALAIRFGVAHEVGDVVLVVPVRRLVQIDVGLRDLIGSHAIAVVHAAGLRLDVERAIAASRRRRLGLLAGDARSGHHATRDGGAIGEEHHVRGRLRHGGGGRRNEGPGAWRGSAV